MSQNYSFKFDQMRGNNATEKKEDSSESQSYDQSGHVRNLSFAWPDGRRKFLNYAYLVSTEYSPSESLVLLAFTSETVTLKGIRLEKLYEELRWHLPKEIVCQEERYISIDETDKYVITEIKINKSSDQ